MFPLLYTLIAVNSFRGDTEFARRQTFVASYVVLRFLHHAWTCLLLSLLLPLALSVAACS